MKHVNLKLWIHSKRNEFEKGTFAVEVEGDLSILPSLDQASNSLSISMASTQQQLSLWVRVILKTVVH